MVRTLVQDGRTKTYTYDAAGRPRSWTDTNDSPSQTRVDHYSDDSDSTSWTREKTDGSDWTRYITGLNGVLAVTHEIRGANNNRYIQLFNLHGDIFSVASLSSTAPIDTFENLEFGEVRESFTTNRRYRWLGSKQRITAMPKGAQLMGVRVYMPHLGRFLQTDPVADGSANSYDYAFQDPVNHFDLDGRIGRDRIGRIIGGARWRGGYISQVGAKKYRWAVAVPKRIDVRKAIRAPMEVVGGWASAAGKALDRVLFAKGGQGERKGILNRGYVRAGWGWKGSRTEGNYVFRIALGGKGKRFHIHIDIFEKR